MLTEMTTTFRPTYPPTPLIPNCASVHHYSKTYFTYSQSPYMSTHTTHTKVTSSKRRSKKPRKTQNTTEEVNPSPCHLARAPFDIIAEILSHKCSPRDILSLARCSKYFCNTLVQPSSASIWKKARARCLPTPIPDPLPNFTEASYASFLFDGGECEVCLLLLPTYFGLLRRGRSV